MKKSVIAVSGKNGQLGNELQNLAFSFTDFDFVFAAKEELNLENADSIYSFFQKYQPSFFINCAAYTAVDKADQEQETAYKINAEAVGLIAKLCEQFNAVLIQISTDYVFSGDAKKPYKTNDTTDPVNYYGYTKWMGEKLALENCSRTIVIRTSWVYSEYRNNFVKTMLRMMKEKNEINVVSDQFGSPTHAKDLAEIILKIILQLNIKPVLSSEIYHFSNDGEISWYDFALAIKNEIQSNCKVNPIATSQYPTPAKRPAYSVMDKQKIADSFHISLKPWQDSLQECLQKINHTASE